LKFLRHFLFRPLLLSGALLLSVPSGAQLPSMGDEVDFPLRNERVIGDWIARNVYRDPDYIDDPILQQYVQGIWSGLMEASRNSGHLTPELQERLAWRIFLDRDPSVNAYAMPGAYMGVNMGLIALVQTRSELAGVLAHEITHVTQRHIARSIGQQGRQAPWMMLAMLVGVAALGRNPEAAQAAIVGSQAVSAQSQLNFSRDMEREADRIGFSVMTRAGYEPEGMVEMFRKLEHANRINDTGNYPYLRSHPLTGERISDMGNRMSQLEQTRPPAATPANADIMALLMGARAKVLSRPGVDSLQVLSRSPEAATFGQAQPATQLAGLYGAVLASAQLRDEPRTKAQLQQLKALAARIKVADAPEIAQTLRLLEIEIWMPTAGANLPQLEKALAQSGLEPSVTQGMGSITRPLLLVWAQAKVRLGQAQSVVQALPTWISVHTDDAAAWRLLSAANESLGLPTQAVRAEAEARVIELDYAGALERLVAAQSQAAKADHFEQSILQSRIRAVRLLQAEQHDNEKVLR
jgi:predicted Zn-dependent protease